MMRKIYCCKCSTFVGEIANSSKLIKDLHYLCSKCKVAFDLASIGESTGKNSDFDFNDLFSMLQKKT